MSRRFNPPPGWPAAPSDFAPEDGWRPDASWPPAPDGWSFWLDEETISSNSASPRATAWGRVGNLVRSYPATTVGTTGLAVLALLGAVSGGVSGALVLLGLALFVVALIGVLRGRVAWARLSTRTRSWTALAGALALMVLGAAIAGPTAAQTAAPLAAVATTPTTAPTTPAAEPTPSPSSTSPSAATTTEATPPAATTTVAPRPPEPPAPSSTSIPAKPATPKPVPPVAPPAAPPAVPAAPAPSPSSAFEQSGVHPGAFCSPHLSFGHTNDGTLMQCKPSATDARFRWRAA